MTVEAVSVLSTIYNLRKGGLMNELIIKTDNPLVKGELTATSWNLPDNITQEEWEKAGDFLVTLDQARQWWLGDWWNKQTWGDGEKACDERGVNYQTAMHAGKVCRQFQFCRRRQNLSFSHHNEVCVLESESMQDKLLDWCLSDEKRKTVKELREKVQAYLAMKDWHESEKARRFDVEAGKTVVANMSKDINLINWAKTEGLFTQIDRSTQWGNPFEIPSDGDRETVCNSYEVYFSLKKSLHTKIKSLKGKVLGCHCYPERCHGDFLVKKVNELAE